MLVFGLAKVSQAHFGMILPSATTMVQCDKPDIEVILAFCHPFEQNGMVLAKPKKFGAMSGKTDTDLTNTPRKP